MRFDSKILPTQHPILYNLYMILQLFYKLSPLNLEDQ
jgi:hypothetical protein